ncbi:MAG: hypothetical protein HC824_17415 [Synechococcales cyanobacterium RM1_1_8]|nr:hypothetical protein [Synechococcales cyanobacterium RM1_1_8]
MCPVGNQGGDIRVEAGALHLANRSEIQSVGLGSDAGDLDIQVQRGLRLTGGSQIGSNSLEGRGGQVSVTAGNIDIRETSIIGSTTLAGDQAGSLNIAAQESITLDQGLIQTTSFNGGGDIFITTQNGDLRLQQSSGIVTSSIGESNTGNVTLEIAGDIIGSGISLISTSSFSTGASGGININARSLNLSQASQVATAVIDPSTFDFSPALLDIAETLGTEVAQLFEEAFARGANSPQSSSGLAGNIDIRVADTVLLDSQAVISTVSTGRGSSGRLAIQAQDLLLNDRSQLLSESQGIGSAGLISASLSGQLGSRNSSIVASSNQGRGGNISISSDSVFLAESSLVGSSVFDSTGDSGDISIQSNSFVAIEDSDILANAEQGLGGEIRISSPAFLASLFSSGSATPVGRVFGSFEQFRGNSRVDISAEAALPENSGTTEFPRVDPAQGLQTFPVVLPDPSSQIDRSCKPQSEASKSAFFITGRSGLPQRPSEPMESRIGADQAAWVPLPQS